MVQKKATFTTEAQGLCGRPMRSDTPSERFALDWPRLFHVTNRKTLPSIRRYGLLSAARLCELFDVPNERRAALLGANRDGYEPLQHPLRGTAVLRRQKMRDQAMHSRLTPGLTPADWRRFINGLVFFVTHEARAIRLRDYDRDQDQIILFWCTRALLDAGLDLRVCRYNNGMVDRSPPGRRRLRAPSDYVPLSRYAGGPISEVAVPNAIPGSLDFTVWRGST